MIPFIEQTMYQLSDFFMAPVLIIISLLFIYALFATGKFFAQSMQRKSNHANFLNLINDK